MNILNELNMVERISTVHQQIFIDPNKSEIQENKEAIQKLIDFLSNISLDELDKSNIQISEKVVSIFDFLNKINFFELSHHHKNHDVINTLEIELQKYLLELPEVITELQDKNRFKKYDEDKFSLKIKKTIKILFLGISRNSASMKSKIKKLPFSKDDFTWNRNINFRNFCTFYLITPVLKETEQIWLDYEENILQERFNIFIDISEFYQTYLQFEQKPGNLNSLVTLLKNLIEKYVALVTSIETRNDKLIEAVNEKINLLVKSAEQIYPKAGTIELPNNKYSFGQQKKQIKKNEKYFSLKLKHLKNYIKAISSSWIAFSQIASINVKQFHNFNINATNLENIFKHNIESSLEKMIQLLNDFVVLIENNSGDYHSEIRSNRTELTEKINVHLIEEVVHQITFDNPNSLLLSKIEEYLLDHISKLPEEIIIVRDDEIDFSIREKDFQSINPKEIINSDISVEYKSELNKLKNIVNSEIKKFSSMLIEIGQVIDYNLETAISILDSTEIDSVEKSKKTALEGIERALARIKSLQKNINTVKDSTINKVAVITKNTGLRLDELTNYENVLKIKLQVSKAKAKEKTKLIIRNTINNIRYFVPILLRKTRYLFNIAKNKINSFGFKVGLSEQKQNLSLELTDFLLQTEDQIKRLPTVYQRIFSKNAVQDERFVFGRIAEQNQIISSYNFWKTGKRSSIVVVGEKGNGNSTVVINATSKFENSPKIILFEIRDTLSSKEELFQLISENLNIKKCGTEIDLINEIKKIPEKIVFVLENIEGLFLRVINGFEPIESFARIITLTNHNIFWLCTCNLYSWNYLERVLKISDFFQTVIKLGNISKEEIQRVILKRHAISGYDLEFLLPPNASKKLLNHSFEEQQVLLKEEYFEQLHNLAVGNLRLSHLFWLRSISEFDGEKIKINSLSEMNFSFLKELEDKKLFTLMAMILHDGITIDECSKIFNMSKEDSEMLISAMVDDGIALESPDGFKVNFLLYAVVIKILKDKNIIH